MINKIIAWRQRAFDPNYELRTWEKLLAWISFFIIGSAPFWVHLVVRWQ